MCHFITAVLPADADAEALDAILRPFGRRLLPIASTGVRAWLRTDERYFLTTLGHCDCGTSLGSGVPDPDLPPPDPDAHWALEAKRLRRKGWTESKIRRALAPRIEAVASERDKREAREREDLERWRDCLRAVLASRKTDRVGLLHHEYCGALDCRVALRGRREVPLAELDVDVLREMPDDVLYEFRR